MTWKSALPTSPRCGHKQCARMRMLGSVLALLALCCIIAGTHGRHLDLAALLAAGFLLTGWAVAYTWPHPRVTQTRMEELLRQEDLEALIPVVGECWACETGTDAPCRCTHDCGHRMCTGWYADYERAMSR